MKLKQYRKQNGIRMMDLAARVEKTVQHLYEIERGSARPSAHLALRIQEATQGQVSVLELLYPNREART